MPKISSYQSDTSPSLSDFLLGDSAAGPNTNKFQIGVILALLGNITSSNILSQNLASSVNGGSAGGTIYTINIGGIKFAFCVSANTFINSTANPTANFDFPTSFFNNAILAIPSFQTINTNSAQSINVSGLSNSIVTVQASSPSTTTAETVAVLVVGT